MKKRVKIWFFMCILMTLCIFRTQSVFALQEVIVLRQPKSIVASLGDNVTFEISAENAKSEYSCAAEPPVRGGVSHLSRRNEPL